MNFIQQAYKGKNEWWRYFLSILLILIGWQIIGIIPIVLTAYLHSENIEAFYSAAYNNFMGLGINTNLYLLMMIMMFIIGLGFLLVSVDSIHKRPIKTVLTSRETFDWNRFFFAAGIWAFMAMSFMVIDYATHPQDFVWNFKPQSFVILVFISLIFLPFQTGFEEVLFRGYLMQGMGILVKNRWIPLLLTSLIFGLLHSLNPEVEKLGMQLMFYYIGTGLLFGMVTLMDEGLELSMGLHAANNVVAAIFVITDWTVFQTDALFIDTSEPNITFLMYVPLFIVYPIMLYILTKKYQWTHWKEKLTGSVKQEDLTEKNWDLK